MNGILHGNEDTGRALDRLAEMDDEKFRKIFTLLYEENLKIDLFEQFSVESIFEIRILSVDSKYVCVCACASRTIRRLISNLLLLSPSA